MDIYKNIKKQRKISSPVDAYLRYCVSLLLVLSKKLVLPSLHNVKAFTLSTLIHYDINA